MDKTTLDLSALLRARNTLLWITSREEIRVEQAINEAATAARYEIRFWDVATGLTNETGQVVEQIKDPVAMLNYIRDTKTKFVYVLRDLHKWFDSITLRTLRSLVREIAKAPSSEARSIVLLTPSSDVPLELSGCTIVIEWPIPSRDEIAEILDSIIMAREEIGKPINLKNGEREAAIDAAVGLNAEEAQACYSKSLVVSKTIDPVLVSNEKKRVIAREKVLTWTDPDPRGLDAVGGLELLKEWLVVRKVAFTKQARDYGLPVPKGVFFVSPPGCGKSLLAKAVAGAWGYPLLRLDLGALKSKWVGESEANIRKALKTAETVAPCVLWIDEIEKAMGGAGSGAADGGVSADALGAVLTWMQERITPVFVVATANDVSILPPELLRKGRFDEMFFIDLPNQTERADVLTVTLRQYKIDPKTIKLVKVAGVCAGFSGAEVAAIVPDAMFAAFNDKRRALQTMDLIMAAEATTPLSKSSNEKITKLREWAKGRTRPASMSEVKTQVNRAAAIDLE